MKRLSKLSKFVCTVLLLAGLANLFTGCNDDMPAESYYTFTGEMMSDFLIEHENFCLFKRIAERAGKMDFLGSRGSRTFFPATNAGVEAFLKEKGYASVEDIPASFCDTLLRACIIERIMYTYDLPETQQENNELDLPLIFESKGDTLDANQMALTIVNRRAAIINELKNDSVGRTSRGFPDLLRSPPADGTDRFLIPLPGRRIRTGKREVCPFYPKHAHRK